MENKTFKSRTVSLTGKELESLAWIWFLGTASNESTNIYRNWRDNPELSELYNKLFK